jgi:lysine-specific demethylase/histidyl-hydroxylase NO66
MAKHKGKGRRHNQHRGQSTAADDFSNGDYDDKTSEMMTTTSSSRDDGKNNHRADDGRDREGGGGGGGMSRAAKKRAKKRSKISSSSGTRTTDGHDGENNAELVDEDEGNNGAKSKKVRLALFDDNDDDGGDDDILEPSRSDGKVSKSTQKNKSATKPHNAAKGEIDGSTSSVLRQAKYTTQKENAEGEDDDAIMDALGSDTEIEPELEELLSTLTPLQILLLDRNGSGTKKHDDGDDGLVSDIDPLQIIPDVTTEHRARVLLGSLLSPSGVTVDEFYDKYWGKLPLLACFEQELGDDGDDAKSNGWEEDNSNNDEIIRHVTRLDGFLNRKTIDEIIQKNKLRYGLDLNVTRYTDAMGSGVRRRIALDPPPKKRIKPRGGKNLSSNNDDDGGGDVEYVVANPSDIWTNVDTSHCTLRLLRPHEHNDNVHALLSLLESEFGCQVGSNAYLTPLNSQGFAPHYDDVDVFILQLEGYKRWKVYAPFSKRETLPRESSRDYTEREVEEMGNGELMDIVLGPGDVLYLPRGWIHQAETVHAPSHLKSKVKGIADDHSLHLTVSAMQSWCWADFLDILMPDALESAAASDKSISLREGLPRNFLGYMGTMHQVDDEDNDGAGSTLPEGLKQAMDAQAKLSPDNDRDDDEEQMIDENRARQRHLVCRKIFKEEARKRIMRVCKQAMSMLDDACDQIGKRYLSDRLPPAFLDPERSLTKDGMSDNHASSSLENRHRHNLSTKIWPNTLCRIVRPNIARLVVEDDKAVLYHCLDNSRVFRGTPLSPMEFEIDDAPALEQLLTTVEPHWIMVKDLIHGDIEDKMEIAQALLNEGILATMLVEAADTSVQTG